jgi:predicted metal-binding protein
VIGTAVAPAGSASARSARAPGAGAFSEYQGKDVTVAAYTTCGGCPGGNIESAPEEMKKNGVDVIHFGTCFLVGYPPCDRIGYFKDYIEQRYGIPVVIGTHPIPEKYAEVHAKLGTWNSPVWQEHIKRALTDAKSRLAYN